VGSVADLVRPRRRTSIVGAVLVMFAGCTAVGEPPTSTTVPTTTTVPSTTTTTLADCSADPVELPSEINETDVARIAVELSRLTYGCAHEAVVTARTAAAIRTGAALAAAADVPVLVEGDGVAAELDRLGVRSVRWVGLAPSPHFGVETTVVGPDAAAPQPTLPAIPEHVWVLDGVPDVAPIVEVVAATRGAGFVDVGDIEDLRTADEPTRASLRTAPVAIGLDDARRWQLATVQQAAELPGGGFTFDGKRLVAFYGNPTTRALGVLGEQDPAAALARMEPLVAEYSADGLAAVPTFEIIATIASARPTANNDYSQEMTVEELRPWIDFAAENDAYVILDLQPGRTDFLTQAKMYEEFLRQPHVGVALDPEWRLKPDQVHLRQIGTVDAAEINSVSEWLADIVRTERLPQKYFIVHQFRFSMITNRDLIRTPPELFTVIQMDGQGPLAAKYETFSALTAGQEDVGWSWGWKNFYDEDSPMATPEQVLELDPVVVFVSFQ
jgi:hypothetical protein